MHSSYLSNCSCGQNWGCNCSNIQSAQLPIDHPESTFYSENIVNCEKPNVNNNNYCNYQQQISPSPTQIVPRVFYNSFPNVANTIAAGQLYANPAFAPCQQTVTPWNYSLCYGYYGQHQPPNPCQFTQFIDIEDF
uniref:Uncharacterized protein n=1 Tax=Megaselia scalaris TaxID=36166 RepID=T1H493_MEGSC